MKQIIRTIAMIAILATLSNAETISDKSSLTYKSGRSNINPTFFHPKEGELICKSNTLYYVTQNNHGDTLAISFNPETKEPYYCNIPEPRKITAKGIFGQDDIYIYTMAVYHEYQDIKKLNLHQ